MLKDSIQKRNINAGVNYTSEKEKKNQMDAFTLLYGLYIKDRTCNTTHDVLKILQAKNSLDIHHYTDT